MPHAYCLIALHNRTELPVDNIQAFCPADTTVIICSLFLVLPAALAVHLSCGLVSSIGSGDTKGKGSKMTILSVISQIYSLYQVSYLL